MRPADRTQQTDQDIFLVEILNFQIIKTLAALFIGKKLDMLFDERLILFRNAKIKQEQGSPIGKEALGIQQGILQMIVPHIRFRKWRIDQVVCAPIYTLQKILGVKLIVRPEAIDLRIRKLCRLHVLGELCLIIVPENQFPALPGKFRIQAVYDLFQV